MECACNCGGITAGGNFLPGHDQRLRAELERRVGGIMNLRLLVEAAEHFVEGSVSSNQFNCMVQELFKDLGPT